MLNVNLRWVFRDLIPYLTKHETWDTSARGTSAQRRDERSANLPVCEDAGYVRTVSIEQYFMTRPDLDALDTSSVCREYTHPRDHHAAYAKRIKWSQYKISPSHNLKLPEEDAAVGWNQLLLQFKCSLRRRHSMGAV